jgi:hypothetical protein
MVSGKQTRARTGHATRRGSPVTRWKPAIT